MKQTFCCTIPVFKTWTQQNLNQSLLTVKTFNRGLGLIWSSLEKAWVWCSSLFYTVSESDKLTFGVVSVSIWKIDVCSFPTNGSAASLFTNVNLDEEKKEDCVSDVRWQFDDYFASYLTRSQTPPQSQTSCLLLLSFLEVDLPNCCFSLPPWIIYRSLDPLPLRDFLILSQLPSGWIISDKQ